MGRDKEIIIPKQEEVRIENAERQYDNSHIRKECERTCAGTNPNCSHFPKHFAEAGYPFIARNYKDVPGWINDAEKVYAEAVENANNGDHFVEIGTLLGQSATHMAQEIKNSGKKIKFDSIDLFWTIPDTLTNYKHTMHPHQFWAYYEMIRKSGIGEGNTKGANVVDIIKNPLRQLGLEDYVNFITCDEKYAHRLYDDESLKFVWIDGDHQKGAVYTNLVNFWPNIKRGGIIAGDDMMEVRGDIERFIKDYERLQQAGHEIPPIGLVQFKEVPDNHFIIQKNPLV